MKRFMRCVIVVLCFFLLTIYPANAMGVLCNSSRTQCTVGDYTFQGTNLYVKDGIMCNSNRTVCSNGTSIYRTSGISVETSKSSKRSKSSKKKNVVVSQGSKADVLIALSDLYSNGLIKQNEFNMVKANLNRINMDRIIELKKIGKLYKNNLITQSEYNRAKKYLLR